MPLSLSSLCLIFSLSLSLEHSQSHLSQQWFIFFGMVMGLAEWVEMVVREFWSAWFVGDPQRPRFWAKAEMGKPDKDLSISLEKWLPETLKSYRFGRFRPKIELENRFSLRRSIRRWVKPLTNTGTL